VWATSPEGRFLHGKMVWVQWDVEELKQAAYEGKLDGKFEIGLVGF
jgi:hypothetical protein